MIKLDKIDSIVSPIKAKPAIVEVVPELIKSDSPKMIKKPMPVITENFHKLDMGKLM